MALLELAQPSAAEMMPLAPAADTWPYQPGESIIVAGWGQTSATSDVTPAQLQWTNLTVQRNGYCALHFTQDGGYDARSMFCASQPGTAVSVCHGDSGAPAVVESADGTYETIGVVSLTRGGCQPPDQFARVSYLSTWLETEAAVLQAEAAASAPPPPMSAPRVPKAPPRKPPSLRTGLSTGAPGRTAKLRFWVGSESGRLHVHLRVMNRGRVIYSTITQYFQPTPGVYTLAWKVPSTLTHSVRFCMWTALYASGEASSPVCSDLRIKQR
jgi:hypothetical protein